MAAAALERQDIRRNADADWHQWPVDTYLAENYRKLHTCDAAVIAHHSAFYRRIAGSRIERSVEIGAGPNLYPLLLAAGACRSIDALDPSTPNVAYLRDQITGGPDDSWQPFYDRCRALNADLPATITGALQRVTARLGDFNDLEPASYDLASMNFVAESISEDLAEVTAHCRTFARSVRPGGHLVATFMEQQARYQLGDGSQWPGCPIDMEDVRRIFGAEVDELTISRIESDPDLPDYYGGYTGMILLTARRPHSKGVPRRSVAGARTGQAPNRGLCCWRRGSSISGVARH